MAEPQLQFTIPRPNTPVLKPNGQMRDEWFNFLVAITTNVIAAGGTVTHTGALVLNRLVVGNGLDDIRAVAGADGQIPIAATSDGTVQFQNITGTLPVVVTNSPHGIAISAPTSVTGAAGANTDIQYNDGGAFGGDANLTWDKTTNKLTAHTSGLGSQVDTMATSGAVALNAPDNTVMIGMFANTSGDYIPTIATAAYVFASGGSDSAGIELQDNQTPGTPLTFATGKGISINGGSDALPFTVEAYQYGGLGTGAVPGMGIGADRNDSGTGAASTVYGQLKDGRFFVIWMDATGAMRYNVGATLAAIRPTEDNSVSDTSGSLFGAGLSAAQVAARVAVGV